MSIINQKPKFEFSNEITHFDNAFESEVTRIFYSSYVKIRDQKLGSQEIHELLQKMTEMRVELSFLQKFIQN